MGKRLPKAELLAEIHEERELLVAALAAISAREISRPGRNAAGWSIKDVLTHLFDWETRVLEWYEAGVRGESPELPAPGRTWRELPALNNDIFRRHRRKSVAAVLREFEKTHERTLAAIERMSDREMTSLGHYGWTGPSWTLSDFLRANTASHYRWARTKIRKWLRGQTPE